MEDLALSTERCLTVRPSYLSSGQDLEAIRPQTRGCVSVEAEWPDAVVPRGGLLWTTCRAENTGLRSHPALIGRLTSLLTVCTILKK